MAQTSNSALATIGRAFEADRGRHPDLMHFLVAARDGHYARLTEAPWDQEGVQVGMSVRPVHGLHGGNLLPSSVKPGHVIDHGLRYSAGYYGCSDQVGAAINAIGAFQRLADRAWEALPVEVRRNSAIADYIDLSADAIAPGWRQWLLFLYASAWRDSTASQLAAPREWVYRKDNRLVRIELEHWIQLPDPVQVGVDSVPRDVHVAEAFLNKNAPFSHGQTPAAMGFGFPPPYFAAFLEPDLFLASKLAIDALLDESIASPAQAHATVLALDPADVPPEPHSVIEQERLRRQNEFEEEQHVLSLIREKAEVFPGKLLTNLPNSFCLHPLDDEAFDPALHVLVGVSVWGPIGDHKPGLARIATTKGDCFSLIHGYQQGRPSCGVPILDAWILRAHVARSLLAQRGDQRDLRFLSVNQWRAATIGIVHVLRSSAMGLLNSAPSASHSARVLLARIADATQPSEELIDSAIAELYATAHLWPKPESDRIAGSQTSEREGALNLQELPDPVSNAALAKYAGMDDANNMSQQLRTALHEGKNAVPIPRAGKRVYWTHMQLRKAGPYLPTGLLRAALIRSGLLKPD